MGTTVTGPRMAVYGRISRESEEDRTRKGFGSAETQAAELTRFAVDQGAEVAATFLDTSLSAWDPRVQRPGWDALMVALESGQVDGVVVWEVSRFARRVRDGERLIDLADRGVQVWSRWGSHDLTTPQGRLAFRGAISQAQFEAELISQRTTNGRRRSAEAGVAPTGGKRALGFPGRNHHTGKPEDPAVVEAERDMVRTWAARILAGDTLTAIVKDANASGFRMPSGHGMDVTKLKETLKRPSVAGLVVHQGHIMGEASNLEPILDRQTWEAVLTVMKARKRGRPLSKAHLLSGLAKCSKCGAGLGHRSRVKRAGVVENVYTCAITAGRKGCGGITIHAGVADLIVEREVLARLADPEYVSTLAETAEGNNQAVAEAQDQVTHWESMLADLADHVDTFSSMSEYLTARERLSGRLEAAQAVLEAAQAEAEAGPSVESVLDVDWFSLDMEGKRTRVRELFPSLTVGPSPAPGRRANPELDRERFGF